MVCLLADCAWTPPCSNICFESYSERYTVLLAVRFGQRLLFAFECKLLVYLVPVQSNMPISDDSRMNRGYTGVMEMLAHVHVLVNVQFRSTAVIA